MEFISTEGMTNETAPEGMVLVQYLEPFFGGFVVELGMGHFDNPNDYEGNAGDGWCHWSTGNPINVLAYAILPKKPERINTPLAKLTQPEFEKKIGSYHPNLGSVGGLTI